MTTLRSDEAAELELPGAEMHAWLHGLRGRGPLVEVPFAGRPTWLILGHAELSAAFKDEATFPAGEHYKRVLEPSQGRTFQGLDGPEHQLLRTLATPAFRPRALRSWQDELQPLAHELVDRFAGDGRVDLVQRFTKVYPFLVISRMLGVPREREEEFHGWATAMLRFDPQANKEFTQYMLPVVAQRRREPEDDVISGLLRTEVDGRSFSDEEVLSHVRLIFSAGATTTFDAMGSLLYALLTLPEVLERVRHPSSGIPSASTSAATTPRSSPSGSAATRVRASTWRATSCALQPTCCWNGFPTCVSRTRRPRGPVASRCAAPRRSR